MSRFILLKFLRAFALLVLLSVGIFWTLYKAPADHIDILYGFNPKISEETRQHLKHYYGLDKPITQRYFSWMQSLVKGDMGVSLVDGQSVTDKIIPALALSATFAIVSLIFSFMIAFVLGLYCARHPRGILSALMTHLFNLFYCLPTFWIAMSAIWLVCVHAGLLPVTGLRSVNADQLSGLARIGDLLRHCLLPILVMTITLAAALFRYTVKLFSDYFGETFYRSAIAYAMPARDLYGKYLLKNASLAYCQLLALWLPSIAGGSLIIESVFSIPGMGRLFLDAAMAHDYPVMLAILMLICVLTLFANVLCEILLIKLDPRTGHDHA